jgi:hypothetical protein
MRYAALAVLAQLACTTDKTVLGEGESSPITSCAGVWSRGVPGRACDFRGTCERETGDTCCTGFATCRQGTLVMDSTCTCTGTSCASDADCTYGVTVCGDAGRCVACPSADDCPACPEPLERRVRNGCASCICTPQSQCAVERGCETGVCYRGGACAEGCTDDDATCCANVCAAAGCTGVAPLGCSSTSCDAACDGAPCITTECACLGDRWYCSATCMPGARASCHYD